MDSVIYCAQCGLPIREDAAMRLPSGDRTHQGKCYLEYTKDTAQEEQRNGSTD